MLSLACIGIISGIVYYCYHERIICVLVIGGRPPCKRDALPTELTAQIPKKMWFISFRLLTSRSITSLKWLKIKFAEEVELMFVYNYK